MKIKKLHIKNFFSIKELFIELSENGIVSIEGKNKDNGGSNGVGKSTIYEAIVWGLFGRTIRKTVQDSLVNTLSKKECEVTITLDSAEIKRGIKPPYLHLKIDGKTYIKESVVDTQKFIEETLKISYKPFLVSHVFGQQNEIDFTSASAEDKRLIIKTFLGLDEFFSLRDKFKAKKNETFGKVKSFESLCISAKANYARKETENDSILKSIEEIKTKYNVSSIDSLPEILLKEERKNTAAKKWEDSINLLAELEIALKKQKGLLTKPMQKCSACGVTSKTNLEEIQKHIHELQFQIEFTTSQCVASKKEFETIVIPISSKEYSKISNLDSLRSTYTTNLQLLEEYKNNFQESQKTKVALTKEHDILVFWENVFSEQGIIKYVVHNILGYLNERCQFYLSILTNGKMSIEFNDEFNEKIKVGGSETYYTSLSGGERKKVNFAILLGLQSLLTFTSRSKFNFLLLDEVVESIDDESISNFYNLLSELSKDNLVMVISHNSALKEHLLNHRKIKLVKSKGITKLV